MQKIRRKPIKSRLAEQLRKRRIELGYTQKQIADYLVIDKSDVSRYETGARIPPPATLKKYCDIYKEDVTQYLVLETDTTRKVIKSFRVSEKMLSDLQAMTDDKIDISQLVRNVLQDAIDDRKISECRNLNIKLMEHAVQEKLEPIYKQLNKILLEIAINNIAVFEFAKVQLSISDEDSEKLYKEFKNMAHKKLYKGGSPK